VSLTDPHRPGALLRLGLLLGVFEAIAIVRYDHVMDDPRLTRLLPALGWALAIVALNTGAVATLGRLLRGRLVVTGALLAVLIAAVRAAQQDRFEWISLALLPAAALLLHGAGKRRWLLGPAAVAIAGLGLWGRVPIYSTPALEQFVFHAPAAILVTVMAALPRGRALAALGLATVAWAIAVQPSARVDAGDGPNVLIVLVDTLRVDHTWPHRDTPALRRLAEEGTTFSQAITVIPKTTQSVAAMQTGHGPVGNGVRVLLDRLPADATTLAEVLSDAGYRTGAMVHNGWVMRGRGFDQGYEQFWSYHEIERVWGPLRLTGVVTALDAITLRRARPFDGNTDAATVTDRALDWLDEDDGRPFYLYVHTFDPHWPYRPPGHDGECKVNNIRSLPTSRGQMIFDNPLPDEENDRAVELYGAEVDHNLEQLDRLLSAVSEDTIVVFTADHGHHLGDHDYWYHHGEMLYEPGVRIPMILRYPPGVPAGAVEERQFRSIDLMPTVLELANIPAPATEGVPWSQIQREGAPPAFLETDISYFRWNKQREVAGVVGKVRGVRDGRWKLHFTPTPKGGRYELYDLQSDPAEAKNLWTRADAEVKSRLMATLEAGIPEAERAALADAGSGVAGSGELGANDRAMLEALGYIED